jgi:hypothetical protein
MFLKMLNRKWRKVNGLFAGHYIDAKVFYTMSFDEVPCIGFIGDVDTSKAFRYMNENYHGQVTAIYQHNYFDHDKQSVFFNNTLFVLSDKRLIELGNNYCHVLHTNIQYDWANAVIKDFAGMKMGQANNQSIGFVRNNAMN